MKNKYKVLIISCWSLLLVCCLIKLLGANIFLASTDNVRFIELCGLIDNSFIKYILYFIVNVTSTSIYFMAVLKETKPNIKWLIPYSVYSIFKLIFNELDVLFFIGDVPFMIALPILLDKKKWKRILIGFGLNLGFQLISQFVKLDNFTMFDENTLMVIILMIDYYIMLILYWLYSIKDKDKKGVE